MKLNIWIILDGKRGHEKQIEDLVFCIKQKIEADTIRIQASNFFKVILNFLFKSYDRLSKKNKPDLIIAAGHGTHLDALQKRNRYGGKLIVIMKSSLPLFLFDLSIIPSHDKILWKKNLLILDGPVNKIKNQKQHIKGTGIILIGGPSKNYFWSDVHIINEIKKIIEINKNIELTLATSRRTPTSFLNQVIKFEDCLRVIPYNSVPSMWLENEIGNYEYSWVTQDSISMLFELINSGSIVTCINLKEKNKKFEKLYTDLYSKRRINLTSLDKQKMKKLDIKISNAEFCANFILQKFILN
jgi:mitochondrial fission protein ELM1